MLRWHILCWQLLWKSILLKLVDLRGCKTTTITTTTNDFVVRTQEEEILGFIMYVRFQRLHEQALRGGKRKKSLQLRLWNLNISIEKNRFEMLIGGYDISNDVITLGSCFLMFVYIRARFCFALIGGDLTAQSTGSHRGIGDGIQIPELQALLPFPPHRQDRRGKLARRLTWSLNSSLT